MCQAAVRIEWQTAMVALLALRRGRKRAYLGAREGFLLRLAVLAHSTSVWLSHLDPLRVPERRLPADSSLPGRIPAREVLCCREDGHVTAGFGDDHLGGAAPDAGDRAQQFNRRGERAELFLNRGASGGGRGGGVRRAPRSAG